MRPIVWFASNDTWRYPSLMDMERIGGMATQRFESWTSFYSSIAFWIGDDWWTYWTHKTISTTLTCLFATTIHWFCIWWSAISGMGGRKEEASLYQEISTSSTIFILVLVFLLVVVIRLIIINFIFTHTMGIVNYTNVFCKIWSTYHWQWIRRVVSKFNLGSYGTIDVTTVFTIETYHFTSLLLFEYISSPFWMGSRRKWQRQRTRKERRKREKDDSIFDLS